MSQEIKTVIVLGGTGHLGPYLISALSRAGFKVTVLSRSSSATSSTIHNAPVVQSDYTVASLVDAFQGQDAVVCAVPTFGLEDQKTIIDAAIAAKVKRFVPNEFGTDTSSVEGLGEVAFMFKGKRDVVDYLKQKQSEGLSWTALITGPWVDWMLLEGQGLLGIDVKTKRATLFDSGDQKLTTTNVAKVGEALAAVLLHPTETSNQYVQVNSFKLTQNLILEALKRVSGNEFDMDKGSAAELLALGQKHLEDNDWDGAYYKLVTAGIYSGKEAMYFPDKAERWNKVLGLSQEETVDEMIARVLANPSRAS